MSRVVHTNIWSAYGYARKAGYEGTEEEFEQGLKKSAEAAGNAEESAYTASEAATEADAARDAAAQSAESASTSEGNALEYANSAAQVLRDAQAVAQTVNAKATEAAGSASRAENYAQTATTKASEAATAAGTATTAATSASGSAQAADASATAAAASETNAAASASSASTSAGSASESADDAAESAAAAQAVKDSIPADYSQLSADVTDLKSQIKEDFYKTTGCKPLTYTKGAYVNLNGTTANVDSPASSARYSYVVEQCAAGDVFTISATAASSDAVWGFVASDGTILSKSNVGPIEVADLVRTAPEGSAYLVINTTQPGITSFLGDYLAIHISENEQAISLANENITALSSDISDVKENVYNNTGNKEIVFTRGAYIGLALNQQLTLTPVLSARYEYAIVDCVPGDIFIISGSGGASTERLYAFIDSTNTVVGSSMAVASASFDGTVLTAPLNSAKLVINNSDFTKKSFFGQYLVMDLPRRFAIQTYQNELQSGRYWELFDWVGVEKRTASTGEISYDYVADGKKGYRMTMSSTSTSDLRFNLASNDSIGLEGINALRVTFYTPDISKFNSIGIEIINTNYSRTLPLTSAKNGWNTLTVYTVDGNINTWDTFRTIRIYTAGATGRDITIAKIELYRPPIGNIIFIEDGGYNSYLNNGYDDLKNLNVPTTWAIDPGSIGVNSSLITTSDIEDLSADGMSEFSFHAWTSEPPTSGMTAQALRNDTMKCLTYLRKNGLLPKYFWRAAFTQNNAPEYMAIADLVEAMATGTSSSSPTSFPFPNKNNIPRVALHQLTQKSMDTMFTRLQKTHCTYVLYTHGVGSGGTYDMTQENWDYFVSALSDALDEGYVRGTTFNALMMEHYNQLGN